MAVKTIGAEFKRFYADPKFWPEPPNSHSDNVWHEDEIVSIDGEPCEEDIDYASIADTAAVTIEGGIVHGPAIGGEEPSFEAYFKRWRKLQTTSVMVVECDVAKLDAVKAAVRSAGGRVV